MAKTQPTADICIIAEGSYPYYSGGVAQWAHELITEHKERTFHVLTLMPPHPNLIPRYQFPSNVIGHTVHIIQYLPEGASENKTPRGTWDIISKTLKGLMTSRTFTDWEPILDLCEKYRDILGKKILTESNALWSFIVKIYEEMHPWGPFKDFFSTAFVLNRSLLSILLPELPPARLYHALCTGYAGFYLYRAKFEKKVPCFLTEQGIYTNERRIEIAMAEWISDIASVNLAIEDRQKNLKDFWLNAFFSLAHACYLSCDAILSTYDGNQELQLEGGADSNKMRVILHGIHPDHYSPIRRNPQKKEHPIVAFAGRVVPIKDIKTFIRACQIVKKEMPEVRFYVLGPKDEDEEYFLECQNLVTSIGMEDSISFFGKVKFKDYLPEIDVLVLTSLSEAQPLVILEGGSTGLPFVSTNVGACYQLCYGRRNESPPLGQGGIITELANPEETAKGILTLLKNTELYARCSETIQKRVHTYYRYEDEHREYRKYYDKFLGQ
jgi:glycosyltransferase involved in cell wall biosynthesis